VDAKSRKALIDSLVVAKNFDASLTEENRRWFVGKVIDVYLGRGESDASTKSKTTAVVPQAKTAAKKHRSFKLGFKLAKDKEAAIERTLKSRRIEILYGLIAHDPELADPTHEKQLLFVAKRRYRVIERFQFFVNPNGRGFFHYPEKCKTDQRWRVVREAETHWKPKGTADLPVELIVPGGSSNIVKAVEKLFTHGQTICLGNLFDCEVTLSILYMDSLNEGKTPKTLFDTLYALGSDHFCINRATHAPLFSADNGVQSLFTISNRLQNDLSVGDHVYIFNHGLYQVLLPGGSWRGEHAVVTDCGDREIQSATGFRFMGHGLPNGGEPGSVPRFYSNLLNELNTQLYRAYRTGAIFLFYKKSGETAFPGQVTKQTRSMPDPKGVTRDVDLYLFDLDYNYPNFEKRPGKDKKQPKRFEHGFVAWHIEATREFGIHQKHTIAGAIADGIAGSNNRPLFRRPNVPANNAEKFDAVFWEIPYPAPSGGEATFAVFNRKGSGIELKKLEMSDLYSHPFFRFNSGTADDMWITRPKVDTGSTYTSFLASKGAI
jgi:hypothetical protein